MLNNDVKKIASFDGGFDHVTDLTEHSAVISVLESTDVQDHVDFLSPEINGHLGLVTFGIPVHGSEGESDHRRQLHFRTLEQGGRLSHPTSVDTHAPELVFQRLGAKACDVRRPSLRLEQGVVDVTGQVAGAPLHAPNLPVRRRRFKLAREPVPQTCPKPVACPSWG